MSLTPPEKVRKLQRALGDKAKASPSYRFYALYDKVYRRDILEHAYRRCKSNAGVAGVDGVSFADVESHGEDRWLDELAKTLKEQTYQPRPLLRAYILKTDGGQRPLGIPTIQDRVVQMAAVLVLGPIFETDLRPEQFAYRHGHSALDAVVQVQALLDAGFTDVVDADLSGYFDTIPHAELMKSLARRISDGRMLALLKSWLEMPVEETDDRGRTRRTTHAEDAGQGTPQGSPISPLLSNIYMRRFVLTWMGRGYVGWLDAFVVNYADDFVILSRGRADEAMAAMRDLMGKLKLTVNERKTRRCRLPEESFTFLGYTFGRCYSHKTGRAYLSPRPAQARLRRLCRSISQQTDRRTCGGAVADKVGQLNAMLRGWANYFCLGPVRKAYVVIMRHVRRRLRRWLCGKHKVRHREYAHFPNEMLHEELGLYQLSGRPHRMLWATS
jgi:RNA-directed DNA polymerase